MSDPKCDQLRQLSREISAENQPVSEALDNAAYWIDRLTAENKALAAQLSKVASDNVDLREENDRLDADVAALSQERNTWRDACEQACEERDRLAAALREAVEYLDSGVVPNKIHSGSLFHRKMRAALAGTAEPAKTTTHAVAWEETGDGRVIVSTDTFNELLAAWGNAPDESPSHVKSAGRQQALEVVATC